jgi:tRNA(adenine34) deaminase
MNNEVEFDDEYWMRHALELAERARQQQEVPVGAILVHENKLIGSGWNQSIVANDATAHAEIVALREATSGLQNYRLPKQTTMYVTLEPCAMCAGALVHARIDRLVFGASDPKTGAIQSIFNILNNENLNHRAEITGGILGQSCSQILVDFFQERR